MRARDSSYGVRANQWIEPTPVEQVFGNDMLLDKILKLAIYNKDKLLPNTFNSCKLVKREWLERATTIASKKDTRSPVNLSLIEDPSNVRNFLRTFKNLPPKRIPPFTLKIVGSGDEVAQRVFQFTRSTFTDCVGCLQQCGARLVKLEMDCFPSMWNLIWQPWRARALDDEAENLRLPNLKELLVGEYYGYDPINKRSEISREFVKTILDGATCLQSFRLHQDPIRKGGIYSADEVGIRNIRLPYSVTHISLSTSEMECLGVWRDFMLINALPKLTSLSLEGPAFDVTYYPILNQFRCQLKKLEIRDEGLPLVRLPVMEALTDFTYESKWGCEDGLKCFPALKRITLKMTGYETMLGWLESGTCPSVEQVDIQFNFDLAAGETLPGEEAQVGLMESLKQAFPNVTHLTVRMPPVEEVHWIKYIFNEMRQIQELSIEICPYDWNYGMSSTRFNAALLGVSVKEVRALEKQRENWCNMDDWSYWSFEDWESIARMGELRRLSFSTWKNYSRSPPVNLDVVLQFALLRMSKLLELSLPKEGWGGNQFEVSANMAQRWRDQGRKLD